jgi:hypothetical protein
VASFGKASCNIDYGSTSLFTVAAFDVSLNLLLLLLLLLLLPQVLSLSDAKDRRLSVTYTSAAPPPAAANGDTAAAPPEEQLVVDALVLATGGFGASKEMLRVCGCVTVIKLLWLL